MTTYNTGNSVPSADARDRYDNSETLDELIVSPQPSAVNRVGVWLKTWYGIVQDFNNFLINSGYEPTHLTYTPGSPLTVNRPTQLIDYNGSVYRVKTPASFPFSLTGVWATDSVNLVDVGDSSVRADLANSSLGATMIAFLQNGVGAIARNVRDKLRDSVSLADFAGSDDGSTNNKTPLDNAKALLGANGVLRLVRRAGGVFRFNNATNLNGVVIQPDPGMTISAAQSIIDISGTAPAKVQGNPLRMFFNDANFDYTLYPEHSEELAEKRIWLDESDADLSYAQALDMSTLRHEKALWPTDDTWAAASNVMIGSNGADWPYISWNSGVASTWYRSSVAVRVGDEIDSCWSTGGVYNRAAFIQHATGYLALYATGINGALVYAGKVVGQTATSTPNVGAGDIFTTDPQYYAENCEWRIKILSKRQFVILLNGQQVAGILTAPGDIMRAGFGFMPVGAINAVAVSGYTRTRKGRIGGRAPQAITIYGDSTTSDIHGCWTYTMRKALEGMGGTIVQSITNLGVPGYTSAQVLAKMQATGFNGNTTVICAGTNDIQGGLDKQQYLANMRASIQLAINNAQTVVVLKPLLWYTQAEVVAAGLPAGTGQASSNAIAGADYRVGLERLCANMGVKLVDLTQVSGPISAKYLNPANGYLADKAMRDNIHQTGLLHRKQGVAVAKGIFGAYSGMIKRRTEVQALPIIYASGWSAYPSAPEVAQMLWTEDGRLQLLGKISSPVTTVPNGTAVGQLREDLWPVVPFSAPCSFSGGNCKVYVSLTGLITVDNFTTGGTHLDLSAIHLVTNI